METSATSLLRHSPQFVLKQVLGGGREERWKFVEEIFKSQITPLYRAHHNLPERILNGSYRCRILYSTKPLGLLVYDKRVHSEKYGLNNCLEIKVIHSIEKEGEDKPHTSFLLDEVIKNAKRYKASSIIIELPSTLTESLNFYKSRNFHVVTESNDRQMLTLGCILESNKFSEDTSRSFTARDLRKRKHEQEKSSDTQKTLCAVPLMGENEAHKRRRLEPSQRINPSKGQAAQKEKLPTSTIRKTYLHYIMNGAKTIEGRIHEGMFRNLQEGGKIQFFCGKEKVICRITKLNRYASFEEMLTKENFRSCIPDASSLEESIKVYGAIPGYAMRAERSGVVAIHIKTLSE